MGECERILKMAEERHKRLEKAIGLDFDADNIEELKNEIIVLRNRVAELERENNEMHERENARIISENMRERINGIQNHT